MQIVARAAANVVQAFCAERTAIDLEHGRSNALRALREVFNSSNEARHGESHQAKA